MSKHTPGPWHTCHNGNCRCKQVWANDHPIAVVESGPWGDKFPNVRMVQHPTRIGYVAEPFTELIEYGTIPEEEAIANARLIAAAPSMLAELIDILTLCVGSEYSKHRLQILGKAEIAIRLALGGDPED